MEEDAELTCKLRERVLRETSYALLLDYLDTLPVRDKDGRPTSVVSVSDMARMDRKTHAQLAVNRIAIRMGMERSELSNDAFCGRRELLLFVGTIRCPAWVKAMMVWYKCVEMARKLRRIEATLGLHSASTLLRAGFAALSAHRSATPYTLHYAPCTLDPTPCTTHRSARRYTEHNAACAQRPDPDPPPSTGPRPYAQLLNPKALNPTQPPSRSPRARTKPDGPRQKPAAADGITAAIHPPQHRLTPTS